LGLGQLLILAVDQATSKCCYYWLFLETGDLKPTEVESVSDDVFNTSFVLFRLRAGFPFSFEHLDQPGVVFSFIAVLIYHTTSCYTNILSKRMHSAVSNSHVVVAEYLLFVQKQMSVIIHFLAKITRSSNVRDFCSEAVKRKVIVVSVALYS